MPAGFKYLFPSLISVSVFDFIEVNKSLFFSSLNPYDTSIKFLVPEYQFPKLKSFNELELFNLSCAKLFCAEKIKNKIAKNIFLI